MDFNCLQIILAMGAPAEPGQQQSPFAVFGFMVPLLVIMYFVMIRPQQKKQKEHQEMIKTVKAGDKVVTSGGIVGVVLSVKDKGGVTIRSADAKLEVTRSAIAEITERGGEKSES